jgi:hypothetical protein
MKQLTRSCDAYAELALIQPSAGYAHYLSSDNASNCDTQHFLSLLVDLEYDILSSHCTLRTSLPSSNEELGEVLGYHRTSVQVNNLYPEWRETFSFPSITTSPCTPLLLYLLLKQSSTPRGMARTGDEIIGQCSIIIAHERMEPSWQILSLPVLMPRKHYLAPPCCTTSLLHHLARPTGCCRFVEM